MINNIIPKRLGSFFLIRIPHVHQLPSSWYRRGAGIPHGRVVLPGFPISIPQPWKGVNLRVNKQYAIDKKQDWKDCSMGQEVSWRVN